MIRKPLQLRAPEKKRKVRVRTRVDFLEVTRQRRKSCKDEIKIRQNPQQPPPTRVCQPRRIKNISNILSKCMISNFLVPQHILVHPERCFHFGLPHKTKRNRLMKPADEKSSSTVIPIMNFSHPAFTMCAQYTPQRTQSASTRHVKRVRKRPRPRAVAPPPERKTERTEPYNPSPSIDNVIIAPSSHGQGLFLRPGLTIPPHHPIARIPFSAALVSDNPTKRITNFIPSSWWRSAEWDCRLAALLLYHTRWFTNERWRRYAAAFPPMTTASDLPLRELAALQYPPLVDAVEAGRFRIGIEFERLRKVARHVSKEDFEWAMKVVHSRAFAFPRGVGGVVSGRTWPGLFALVPLLDMANHASRNAARVRYDNDTRSFVLQAGARMIQGGDEIFVKYGNLTTDDTFLHYGFVEPENPHDYFEVEDLDPWVAELPERHKQNLSEKLRLLERLNLHYEGRKFYLSRRIDHDLLAALRILVSTREEFEAAASFVETYRHKVHDVPGCSFGVMECVSRVMPEEWRRPLGRENEMRVWDVVERVCGRLEKGFGSDELLSDSVRLFHVGKRRVLREVGAVARRRRELWEAWISECHSGG